MARTIVVTGSASGIGEATANRLAAKGHKVIGVDLHGADINADLSSKQGRAEMIERVHALAPDGIDAVLTSAGLADFNRPARVLAVNYFGTLATLEGLRPLMRGPHARGVAVASTALLVTNDEIHELEELCLTGDEDAALKLAEQRSFLCTYPASKRALTRWVRRSASKPEWAGEGKLLNVVAPGVITTPMIAQALANPEQAATVKEKSPMAVEGFANADEVAELMDFLLNYETHYIVGQVIFIDGGGDILQRPDHL